jgi:hypothetical protein
MQYGFTEKEKSQFYKTQQVYSSFGRDKNDFVQLEIYNVVDNTLILSEELDLGEFTFNEEGTLLDFNVGQHLRDLGYRSGTYRVSYKFFRRIAGKNQAVFVDGDDKINVGKIQTKVINGKTRFFRDIVGGKSNNNKNNTTAKELFTKNLKYRIEQKSDDNKEAIIGLQSFKNKKYREDFQKFGNWVKYEPLYEEESGPIKFDTKDPYVLEFRSSPRDRGFTQNMVGHKLIIPNLYLVDAQVTFPPPPPIVKKDFDEVPRKPAQPKPVFDDEFDVKKVEEPTPVDKTDDEVNDLYSQDYYDDYDGVCFVKGTKVRLSNGSTLPINMLRPNMKVKTDKGFAKILKVTKEDKYTGVELTKFGSLITTDGHPIKHKGQWYHAGEIGKTFMSKPQPVYNLILDRHHTIIADGVVSATLGKWKSSSHFEMWRKSRINMIRTLPDEDNIGSSNSSFVNLDTLSGHLANEVIIDDDFLPLKDTKTKEILDIEFDKLDKLPIDERDEIVENLPPILVDGEFIITEVLDHNRVRVDRSYNDMVNELKHIGEDESSKEFPGWHVTYKYTDFGRYKTFMKKGNDYYLITNQNKEFFNGLPFDNKRLFRFHKPLVDCELYDEVIFVEKRMDDYDDVITLVPFVDEPNDEVFLFLPNFNSTDNPINFRDTSFKNYNDLVGTQNDVTEKIERDVLSGSLNDVKLNIDYQLRTTPLSEYDDTGFGNFIHFSSAERRIRNFKKKLELIEAYTNSSSSLLTVTSSASQIRSLELKRQRVKDSFDAYEHFLYYESSSYVSSSEGMFHDTSWPKENSSEPYRLVHTSGSTATTWFDTMISSASLYDTLNQDYLKNNLPIHVTSDTENNVFIEFLDMVGQQFDEVWSYTKHFTDVKDHNPNISKGISKDVVSHYAKSVGLELTNGNDLMILPEYLLGKTVDGSSLYESSQEKVTEEIWKRIFSSLPFFIKSKGTIRALKGLLNCYGIPSSILRVREYGGPDKGTRVSYEVKRKFTYALDFKSSQYVKSEWKTDSTTSRYPETIEFRFRSPKSQDQVIIQKENDWSVNLLDNGSTDDYGKLRFSVSASTGVINVTSSLQPFYNDDMWSVMLTRVSQSGHSLLSDSIDQKITYELTTRQYDASREKILFSTSQSVDINGTTAAGKAFNAAFTGSGFVYLGGQNTNFGARYSGSLMEYRLWTEPLSQSVFENHVRAPRAYNGNSISSSYDHLVLRYPFDDNANHASVSYVSNKSHVQTYGTNPTGSVNGFTGNFYRSLVDLEQLKVPNFGPSRRNATKIRIEDTTLTGNLSPDVRMEKSSQDTAPIDSPNVGIYFSPIDVVNEDIMYSLADFNFDDYIGDPRDQNRYTYRELRKIRRDYWKRYSQPNNFWDYMRILSYYDASIFTQLKQLLPARSKARVGVLIEPNILERSKEIQIKGVEPKLGYYENAGEYDAGVNVFRYVSGSKDDAYFEVGGEYTTYGDGVNDRLNLAYGESGSLGTLGRPTLININQLNPKNEFSNLYATASVTEGETLTEFNESLMPFVSQSRLSEHNEIKRLFYASDADALINNPNSSSFEPAEFESMATHTKLFRTFYQGIRLTKDNTIDGKEPIESIVTTPTTLVTKEPGESKLKVK